MRGAHLRGHRGQDPHGIIPAYAGSTDLEAAFADCIWDHPRVCGEHVYIAIFGKPKTGIIPAYAGSTCHVRESGVRYWDHPRVCGEHLASRFANSTHAGSSPRMRGAPFTRQSAYGLQGIIPAYAGSTTKMASAAYMMRDHPRVCGEHGKSYHKR